MGKREGEVCLLMGEEEEEIEGLDCTMEEVVDDNRGYVCFKE